MLGRTLRNRYQIIKDLGQGGFGDTYLAKDLDLPGHPHCVVKHLQPKDPNPAILPIAKRLFDTEAQILYKLGKLHDQIPTLSAHFEEKGEFYFVQDFIAGHDLTKELIPGKKLSESYTIKLLYEILQVLAIIHQQNVIHRDLKPANLMRRQDGKIVLIDFGAVKEIRTIVVNAQGQTKLTIGIGTPGYMPSEQASGKPRLASDIHAVGTIGIQALTGQHPVNLPEDPQTGELVWRNRTQVSNYLANILDKMVRDHFSQRYQNAGEALQAILSLPPSPATDNPLSPILSQDTPSTLLLPATPMEKAWSRTIFEFETVTLSSTGQITKRHQNQTLLFTETIAKGITLEMIAIPGGSFVMGSPDTESEREKNEGPQHRVNVAPFFMGKYEVTLAQWRAVAGLPKVKIDLKPNPSFFKGDNLPVEQVSWNHAMEFCARLSQLTGRNYRLPSEAQWEYACRARTTTPFYFGDTITSDFVNYDGNNPYGSASQGIYREKTTAVGNFPPNSFGLYDMHGNVCEWCQDVYHGNYHGAPTDGSAWETGGDSTSRMVRGGSWLLHPHFCRSALRASNASDSSYTFDIGFRVARA